jgi:hypothetical protein
VNRLLKTTSLLIVSLFLVVSGVDTALDRLSHSPDQNSFVAYGAQGSIMLAYEGDLAGCKAFAKPTPIVTPGFFHRG